MQHHSAPAQQTATAGTNPLSASPPYLHGSQSFTGHTRLTQPPHAARRTVRKPGADKCCDTTRLALLDTDHPDRDRDDQALPVPQASDRSPRSIV